MELLFKVGNQYPSDHPLFTVGWRDGQLIEIRPDGFFKSLKSRKHFCVIRVPGVYLDLWGPHKGIGAAKLALKGYQTQTDATGKLPWETLYVRPEVRRQRDYFVDFYQMRENNIINSATFNSIYNKSINHVPIILPLAFDNYLLHEDQDSRNTLNPNYGSGGSISIGTGTVGSDVGDDYASWTAAIADLIDLTGDCTLEGSAAEEMSESASMPVTIDTSTYNLYINVASGVEHNGGAYGNGHRISLDAFDDFEVNETTGGTTDKVWFQDLAIDASGNNKGIFLSDGADNDPTIVERCLIKGDVNTQNGIELGYSHKRTIVRNNIIYGCSETGTADDGFGIYMDDEFASTQVEVYNNTCCKNDKGIGFQSDTPGGGTYIAKNNLCQGNATDYAQTSSWDTTAKNVSQDATSPDASYQSMNKQSWFTDYTNNDFREGGSSDTDLDDGDDLSAIGSPAQFSGDIERVTRSLWYIGASEYVAVGGATGKSNPLSGPLGGPLTGVL